MLSSTHTLPTGLKRGLFLGFCLLAPPLLLAQFIPSAPGTYDFNNPANWTGGVITGQFSGDLDGIFTTTSTDLTLSGLSWNHTGLTGASPNLRADGTGDRTLTINNGDITLATAGGFLTAMLGNGSAGARLFVDLAGTTTINAPTSTVFSLQNDATFSGTVTKTGAGRIDAFGGVTVTGSLNIDAGQVLVNGTLTGPGSVSLANGTSLTLGAGGTGNVTAASGSTITLSTSGAADYSGLVTGAGTLRKSGSGVMTLSRNDTTTPGHTGLTFVDQGTLRITGTNKQFVTSGVTIASGATLDVQNQATFGSVSGAGNLIAGAEVTVYGGILNGSISGSGNLVLSSGGTLILNAANTFTGGVVLGSGTLTVGNDAALGTGTLNFVNGTLAASGTRTIGNAFTSLGAINVGGAGDLTLTGNLTLSSARTIQVTSTGSTNFSGVFDGTGSLTKTGSGVLTLSGANTYTGTTTVSAGTLAVGATDTLPTNQAVAVSSGATLAVNFDQTVSSLSGSGSVTVSSAKALTVNNAGSALFSGVISGSGALVKNGAGNLRLEGNNTFTGGITVNAGTLGIGNGGNGGNVTSNISTAAGTQVQFLRSSTVVYAGNISGGASLSSYMSGGSSLVLTGTHTYTGGTTVGEGILRLGNGGTTGSVTGDISVAAGATLQFGRSDDVTYAGVISGDGTVTKTGLGVLTLTGTNTHTGGTSINSGTLAVSSDANLGSAGVALTLGGGTLRQDAALGTLTRNIVTTASGSTINTNGFDLTLTGAISGTGALNKANTAGTLTLSGSSTYTGLTQVQGGTLATGAVDVLASTSAVVLSNAATLSVLHNQTIKGFSAIGTTTSINLGSGATLTLNGSASVSSAISGAGSLAKGGAANTFLTLSGSANTYAGGTTINSGTLRVGNTTGSGTGSGAVIVNSTGVLRGTGFITGDTTIHAGGAIGGGSTTAGTLTLGNVAINPGATFLFNLNNATGTAGTSTGWSLLNLTGTLDLNGTAVSPLTLKLATINHTTGQAATALNFDPAAPSTFLVASAAGGITGFDASAWTFDTSAFQNTFSGAFSLSQSGNNLYLHYAAIPEPSTWAALTGLAALGLALVRRRRPRARSV